MRFGRLPLIRRLRGYGSARLTGPRAHASAPKRTLPSWPNAAPSGFSQALPEGEVPPRLRRSIRKTGRTRFLGRPGPTVASPLSPKPRHCRGTGFYMTIPRAPAQEGPLSPEPPPAVAATILKKMDLRAPARGSSGAAKRRQHLAVGVSPWKTIAPSPEPRRRRQQSSLVFDFKHTKVPPAQSLP